MWKIRDRTIRNELLSNAKKLKDNQELKAIYLSRDLTFAQRQERRAKRAALQNSTGSHPRIPAPNPPRRNNVVVEAASAHANTSASTVGSFQGF